MKKFIKNFDIFSKQFNLTYKGQNNLNLQFGGLLTIFAIIIIIFNGFLIGNDIFYKENPIVLKIERNLELSPTTRMNYNNSFIGFSISDDSNNPIIYEYFLRVIPKVYIFYYDKNNTLKVKSIDLEITDCPSEFERLKIIPPFISSVFKNIKCFKNYDLILSGSWNQNPLIYLNVNVLSCRNETYPNYDDFDENDKIETLEKLKESISSNQLELKSYLKQTYSETDKIIESMISSKKNYTDQNKTCQSIEEIDKFINSKSLNFNIFFNKLTIDPKNFSNPINSHGSLDWVSLGLSMYKELNYYFGNYIVSTDDGFIFSDWNKEEVMIGLNYLVKDYTPIKSDGNLLVSASFYISNNAQYVSREYIKIQNIFANLGGIMKFILLVFQVVYNPFFNRKLSLKIINKIFEFEDDIFEQVYENKKNISNLDTFLNHSNTNKIRINKINLEKSNANQREFNDSGRLNLKKNDFYRNKLYPLDIIKIDDKYLKENISNENEISKFSINFSIDKRLQHKNFVENQNKYDVNKIHISKKLKYKKIEIFKDLYCRCFIRNKTLENKNKLFNWAKENLSDYTDFLNSIKMHRDLTKLKFFIFNSNQMKSFEFINNPKKFKNEMFHHNVEFAQFFNMKNKTENISEIIQYFKNKIKNKSIDKIDEKLLEVIDPNLKSLIFVDKDH